MSAHPLAESAPPSAPTAPPALEVERVSRAFPTRAGRVAALHELSFAARAGELVCVVGPSGCGKSTLLRLVAGLLAPDGGALRVLGTSPAAARAAKRIGYVPQDGALLPWRSALANVAFALQVGARPPRGAPSRPAVEQAARAMLRRVGIEDLADRAPHQLSGGQRQRVALARALVISPALLLLDEPFAALDELSREALRAELLALWERERPTMLFVTHSVPEAVTLADRVLVLSPRPGHLVGEVTVDLPRPRPPELTQQPAFAAAERQVRALLRDT